MTTFQRTREACVATRSRAGRLAPWIVAIQLAALPLAAQIPPQLIEVPQSRMTAKTSSALGDRIGYLAIDGYNLTRWETQVTESNQWIQLDLGLVRTVGAIDVYSTDHRIKDYRLYVSAAPEPESWGDAAAEGTLPNTSDRNAVVFPYTSGRYVTLMAASRHGTHVYLQEMRVYESAFYLADKQTGSRNFTNSNIVDVVAFPVMPGYDRYQITGSPAAPTENWLAYDPDNLPTDLEEDLGAPSEGVTVTRYAWFQDSTESNPTTNAAAYLVYIRDTADVAAQAIEAITVPSWGAAYPAIVRVRQVDTNSTSTIGIFSRTLAVAPVADTLPEDPERIGVVETGSHTVTLTVTDMAGNIATADIDLIVTAGAVNQTTTWTGDGDGWDWFDNANWSADLPGLGAAVTVGAGADIQLTESTAELAVLDMTGGTLTFTGWETRLNAAEVTIKGTLTHPLQRAMAPAEAGEWVPDARVYIVCETFRLESTGMINVDAKGYHGGTNMFLGASGPGGAVSTGDSSGGNSGSGGAHGGFAGRGGAVVFGGGHPYGDPLAPVDPGSGGGAEGGSTRGGHGGGAVRIDASGPVLLNGTITANGSARITGFGNNQAGGGSGGSIYITAQTMAATNGVLRSNGGASQAHGADGAGGRIALHYNPTAQSNLPPATITITALPASMASGTRRNADIGTVYLSDTALLAETINVSGQLLLGVSSWSPQNLTVDNRWIRFPQEGFHLEVQNNLSILRGTAWGRLDLGGSIVTNFAHTSNYGTDPDFRLFGESIAPVLTVGGDMTMTGAAELWVFSAPTNGTAPAYGALVDVTGTMHLGAGAGVMPHSHWSNGGSPHFRMGALIVESGAKFDAVDAGWAGGMRLGAAAGLNGNAYGPGGGWRDPPGYQSRGGSYGGLGGYVDGTPDPGKIYGSEFVPDLPGSGGMGGHGGGQSGGFGGGLIYIDCQGAFTLNGELRANGGHGKGAWAAGGSGGGIYVSCRTFTAGESAVVSADGGNGNSTNGGGGGRIAIWRLRDNSTAVLTPTAKAGNSGAQEGTVFWGWIPPRGTMILLR